ncbi:MAG TPA: SMP-30/gluconolactonase/LRE family protein [Micromonosporaceae bacterium]|nr:SMP-30/gluconolactonase/LRE family protein [Micromonosporaceae bacterium]
MSDVAGGGRPAVRAPRVPRPPTTRVLRPAKDEGGVPPPLDGAWAPEDLRLDGVTVLRLPTGGQPEDVVVDAEGRLVAGGQDGCVWRWPAGGQGDPELVVDTGGRPLGIEVDPRDGTLVICDAYRGLIRVGHDGAVTDLADHAAGTRIMFCNNGAVAADGTVYFTDSSSRHPFSVWRRELLEHRPNGRLLRFDPADGSVDVLADGLYFPNGVALTPDGSALMLVETSAHRLSRVPVGGGEPVVLADLPAYPDNMSAVGDGTYWIALPSPRLAVVERLLPHPGVRRVAAFVPDALQPGPKRYGLVALVDGDGTVLRALHGPAGRYAMITGVRQHGSTLYLGSLLEQGVARVEL